MQNADTSCSNLQIDYGVGDIQISSHDAETIGVSHNCQDLDAEPVVDVGNGSVHIYPRKKSYSPADFHKDNQWTVGVPKTAMETFNLSIGKASASIDLSETPVARLKINQGLSRSRIRCMVTDSIALSGAGGKCHLDLLKFVSGGVSISAAGMKLTIVLPPGVHPDIHRRGVLLKVDTKGIKGTLSHKQKFVLSSAMARVRFQTREC